MLWLPNYNIDELSTSLEILRNDLTTIFIVENAMCIPILYDISVFTAETTKKNKHVGQIR